MRRPLAPDRKYLRGGRLLTSANLAEPLEVTKRTIYHNVADLVDSGMPIEGEAGVGYMMRAGFVEALVQKHHRIN